MQEPGATATKFSGSYSRLVGAGRPYKGEGSRAADRSAGSFRNGREARVMADLSLERSSVSLGSVLTLLTIRLSAPIS